MTMTKVKKIFFNEPETHCLFDLTDRDPKTSQDYFKCLF